MTSLFVVIFVVWVPLFMIIDVIIGMKSLIIVFEIRFVWMRTKSSVKFMSFCLKLLKRIVRHVFKFLSFVVTLYFLRL